jgi:BTB/POZ domain
VCANVILSCFQAIRARLRSLCLSQGLFSDVRFKLDDGLIAAHKALLMARCDVMRAMFSGDFRESAAKVVSEIVLIFCILIILGEFFKTNVLLKEVLMRKPYSSM